MAIGTAAFITGRDVAEEFVIRLESFVAAMAIQEYTQANNTVMERFRAFFAASSTVFNVSKVKLAGKEHPKGLLPLAGPPEVQLR